MYHNPYTQVKRYKLHCLRRVAKATQALENRWIVFHKIPNTKNFRSIVRVEDEICRSLAELREAEGKAKIIDWDDIERVRRSSGKKKKKTTRLRSGIQKPVCKRKKVS